MSGSTRPAPEQPGSRAAPEVSPAVRLSPPCRFRLTIAASMGAYPVITLILYVLGPATQDWAVWQKTLAIVPIMVPAMVFGIIPAVHRFAGPWLRPRARA